MHINNDIAISILNSLKTGVVPELYAHWLAVGYKREFNEFDRCLSLAASGNGVVKFIIGEYGSGKSLMLSVIKHRALSDDFLTVKMQLNRGFLMNNFEVFYYNIMHNLTSKTNTSHNTDFEEIFDRWIKKLKSYSDKSQASNEIKDVISIINQYNNSFARAFLTYIKARISNDIELSSAAASWIKGEKNIPSSIKKLFGVKGDVDRTNSIDFLKAFIKLNTLIGYKGIVILIDELELILSTRSDIRRVSYENLRYLIDSIGSDEFRNCMFVFVGTNDLFSNEEKGIMTYNALAQRLGRALDKNNNTLADTRQPIMVLNGLTPSDLENITSKIIYLHKLAYSWTPNQSPSTLINWTLFSLKQGNSAPNKVNTREFIIKLIEILDIIEQNPNQKLFIGELKLVQKNGTKTFVNRLSR